MALPGPLLLAQLRIQLRQLLFERIQFSLPIEPVAHLLIGEQFDQRAFVPFVCILGLVEDGEDLEIVFSAKGDVLVIVALGASHGHSHPDRHGGVDTIDDGDVRNSSSLGSPSLLVNVLR